MVVATGIDLEPQAITRGDLAFSEFTTDTHGPSAALPASTGSAALGLPSGAATGQARLNNPAFADDSKRARTIVIDVNIDGTRVFGVTRAPDPTWHRFCPAGLMPASYQAATNLIVDADRVTMQIGDGAFGFDLNTPYCD